MKRRERTAWLLCAILMAALLLLIFLEKWGLTLWGSVIDYQRFGNWAEAISGIGTTLAVIVALFALVLQQTIRKEDKRKQMLEEETSIYIWLRAKEIKDIHGRLIGRTWDLIIQNDTKSPVNNWFAGFSDTSGHLCNYTKRPILPNENIFNLPTLDNCPPNNTPGMFIIFRDRSLRYWKRNISGDLVSVAVENLLCEHVPESKNPSAPRQ